MGIRKRKSVILPDEVYILYTYEDYGKEFGKHEREVSVYSSLSEARKAYENINVKEVFKALIGKDRKKASRFFEVVCEVRGYEQEPYTHVFEIDKYWRYFSKRYGHYELMHDGYTVDENGYIREIKADER